MKLSDYFIAVYYVTQLVIELDNKIKARKSTQK